MRMPRFRYAPVLLPLLAALTLAACHGKNEPSRPGGSSPQAALQTSIDLLRAGDFNALWKHALPPADYATLRTDWQLQQQAQPPLTAQDRARFAHTMQQLDAPDAQTRLCAQLQPKLARTQEQYSDQLPVLISVGEALAKKRVAQGSNLSAAQKAQLGEVLDVLTPWAQQAPWFDPARARQAIGVVVATAHALGLKSADQLRTMDFDTTMGKYSQGYAGIKQLLVIYGLSIDDTLQSVKLSPVSSSAGHAVVRIDYTLLGKPLSTTSRLLQQDGRWYSEDLVENVRAAHRQLSQPPATAGRVATAGAGSAAAAPASKD